MDAWDKGQFEMLVQDTERTMESSLSTQQGGMSAAQRAKIFQAKMLCGNLRGAVKFLTDTERGGVLMPDDVDEKTGHSVEDVLRSKHPAARTPDISLFPPYDATPAFVDVDITADVVEQVAR